MRFARLLPPHNTARGRVTRACCCIVALDLSLLVIDYTLLNAVPLLPSLVVEFGGYLARVIGLPIAMDWILSEVYCLPKRPSL